MMKKLFFWLVFLSVGMQGQNVSFADDNFKAIVLSSSGSNTIAKNLSGNYFAIDADGNGEISLTEAQAVSELKLMPKMISFGGIEEPDFNESDSIMNYEGINDFSNATSIILSRIAVPTIPININGLNHLKSFSAIFYNSDPGKISFFNCSNLESLTIAGIGIVDGNIIPQLKKLNLNYGASSGFLFLDKIQNATLLEYLTLTSDSFHFDPSEELILSNHNNLKSVNISNIGFYNIDLSNCNQLVSVSVNGNYSYDNPLQIGALDVSNCPLLTDLNLAGYDNYSGISTLVANNCSSLQTIKSSSRFLQTFSANSCPLLSSIDLNACKVLEVSDVPDLKNISVQRFDGESLDATPATNLEVLNLNYINYSKSPFVNAFGSLKNLTVKNNAFLKNLNLDNQKISDLDVSGMQSLENLSVRVGFSAGGDQPDFSANFLHHLKADNCASLKEVIVDGQSGLLEADFANDTSLKQFIFLPAEFYGSGAIEKLNFENCTNLEIINASQNKLSDLNITNCPSLKSLDLSHNQLSVLDLQHLSNLEEVYCGQNQLITFNIESNPKLKRFSVIGNPSLNSLFIKNGVDSFGEFGPNSSEDIFGMNPSLNYICADENEVSYLKTDSEYLGLTNLKINSYCSFTPGGNHSTISGTVKFDANNNGCDLSDNPFEFLKLKLDDGTTSGETFAQNDGKYEFYTQAGNFNITALAENPTLFTVSPANFSTTFVDSDNHISIQDICVTANGNQNDAEVVFAPITNARPGFDATYKLIWRNKGNTILSGKVVLNYDAGKMTFQNSSLAYSIASSGTLEFDYINLKPFENTASEITFKINTPTNSTDPVNSGDVLTFNAQITPNSTDLTPDDNNFGFNHPVVNSFDPNDIVCLEGEKIPSVAVGKYLHYVVNFQNTGTAEAENIVVKMDINPAEFDISTLQLQNASANVETKIVGNKAEFIFKKIKLQSGGHGNVLLKIRSLNTLQEGDNVTNSAEIYFDYNFPIYTNDYTTEIQDENSVLKAKINYEANQFSNNNYPVDFDGSLSTGSISSYQWEFSGNPTISSTNVAKPMVIYSVPGNYTAKLTVSDANNLTSTQSISFNIGGNSADISTGKASDGNIINIDSDDDDWKGFDINGTEMTPKIRQAYSGWSYADIGNGNNSRWISLNNFEGYYTYKSREFAIPENATDAKLNLRSLSFVRNWTYLVKVNPDGSEDEIEITKTQWMNDGFKGWVNSRSPKVDNYNLSAGRYYIKVLVYSNNSTVRQSLDVNAIVSCSAGLIFANKKSNIAPTLGNEDLKSNEISIYPIPTKGEVNVMAKENIKSIELYDSAGRILQNQILSLPRKNIKFNINSNQGVYYLKIKTDKNVITRKVIKN